MKPLIYAHRGDSANAPENTMSAFRMAVEKGADGLEIDVQMSSDGKLVVIHDQTIDRTSSGKGQVKEKTYEELRQLDFGSWFSDIFSSEPIPLLEEVIHLVNQSYCLLNIEIKNGPVFYSGIENSVADIINRYGIKDRTIVSSFNHYSLFKIKRIDPGVKTGILYMAGLYEPWVYAKQLGADAVHPLFYNIVPEIVAGCRQHNVEINTFTVDKPEHIKMMALAGVDGIITNGPDTAVKIIREAG